MHKNDFPNHIFWRRISQERKIHVKSFWREIASEMLLERNQRVREFTASESVFSPASESIFLLLF